MEIINSKNSKPKIVELQAFGSWVYKVHIREALNIQRSDLYLEEIELLKQDIEGFKIMYEQKTKKHRVMIDVARVIVSTIYERAYGHIPEIIFRFEE